MLLFLFCMSIPEIQQKIIKALHEDLGHCGVAETYRRIKLGYWWEGMKKIIKKWVKSCESCQRRSVESICCDAVNFEYIQIDFHPTARKPDQMKIYNLRPDINQNQIRLPPLILPLLLSFSTNPFLSQPPAREEELSSKNKNI
ncbi:hypothetical protein VP01_3655g2 [Puccinia sorghi]|uniref:Integrase zinc-binding domain-containing protein n=1 Tax=Puccinia sorghi TaxID=27349 RepID=A0A0L6UUL7_9BASI|nr:hypothetical protein VP01_3655g2 [Puccinia sorghi]